MGGFLRALKALKVLWALRALRLIILKSELLYIEKFDNPEMFIEALEEYIDYYNNKRIKLRLKGKSPVQYRTLIQ